MEDTVEVTFHEGLWEDAAAASHFTGEKTETFTVTGKEGEIVTITEDDIPVPEGFVLDRNDAEAKLPVEIMIDTSVDWLRSPDGKVEYIILEILPIQVWDLKFVCDGEVVGTQYIEADPNEHGDYLAVNEIELPEGYELADRNERYFAVRYDLYTNDPNGYITDGRDDYTTIVKVKWIGEGTEQSESGTNNSRQAGSDKTYTSQDEEKETERRQKAEREREDRESDENDDEEYAEDEEEYEEEPEVVNNAASAVNGNWQQGALGWWFQKSGGGYPSDSWYECKTANGAGWYHFNTTGYMDHGWFTDKDGQTYYLHDTADGNYGAMLTGWQWIGGKCYYLNQNSGYAGYPAGALLKNATTPDGHTVNAAGEWVVNGVVQMR